MWKFVPGLARPNQAAAAKARPRSKKQSAAPSPVTHEPSVNITISPTIIITLASTGYYTVYVNPRDGGAVLRTSKKTLEDAECAAASFLVPFRRPRYGADACVFSQKKCDEMAQSNDSDIQPVRIPQNDVTPQPTRQSKRSQSAPPVPPPSKRQGNYKAGPGRGYHERHKDSLAKSARGAIEQLSASLRAGLEQEAGRERDPDHAYERAMKIISEHARSQNCSDMACKAAKELVQLQQTRKWVAGASSSKQLRRHIVALGAEIKRMVPGDVPGQVKLANNVALHLQPATVGDAHDVDAHAMIVDGLKAFVQEQNQRHRGRFPTAARVARENLLAVAFSKVPEGSISAVARTLGVERDAAHRCRTIWAEYEAGNIAAPSHPDEPASHLYQWEPFLLEQWTVLTRESERMKDDIHNPHDHRDEKLYRIHWREDR